MKLLRSATAALAFTSTLCGAQPPALDRAGPVDMASLLKLDPERAARLDAILEDALQQAMEARGVIDAALEGARARMAHAAMTSIRADTDQRLAAVLTAAELAKLQQVLEGSDVQAGDPGLHKARM
jgi:hypothetical protein